MMGDFSSSSAVPLEQLYGWCPEHGRGLHQDAREAISQQLYAHNYANAGTAGGSSSTAGILPPVDDKMTSFTLYETKQRMFLVGSNHDNEWYRILKLERMGADPAELRVSEDNVKYTQQEMTAVMFSCCRGGRTVLAVRPVHDAFLAVCLELASFAANEKKKRENVGEN